MINIVPQIFFYNLFYYFGWPKIGPLNITISLTYDCNSRCQTCNIWKKVKVKELDLSEYKNFFKSIGQSPYEVILTGGEPFLKKEIVEICQLIDRYLKPKVIIIPTNGILSRLISQKTEEILNLLSKTKIVLNLSLDGIDSSHDEIRGIPGNFKKLIKTFWALKSIKNKNLDLKIHTVISKFNVKKIPQIYKYVQDNLDSSSFITEIAEERIELENVNSKIAPLPADYIKSISFLISEIKKQKFSGLDKITQAFRIEYYELVKRILLGKKRVIPCYVGVASAQITPDGNILACCIKAESMGNLREQNYDFRKIWRSDKAKKIRRDIKQKKCYCPLANASYTNMLMNFSMLKRILFNYFKLK